MAEPVSVPPAARAAGAGDAGPLPVAVQLMAAKENALFTEEQRQLVVFLSYTGAVPCAACGKRSRYHWTMRVSFQAQDTASFVLVPLGPVHLPLAPVCRAHPLAPAALPQAAARRKEAKPKEPPHA